jgi:DNA-binding response OmpR family regulator
VNSVELKSVLVVDDDKQLASAVQWILADENYLVDVAHDGEEAWTKLQSAEYDSVVCDLMMPRLRGDEFYLKAKALHPQLANRFVFITGFASEPPIHDFLARMDVPYLMKPFPIEALIHSVKELTSAA